MKECRRGGNIWRDQRHGNEKQTGVKTNGGKSECVHACVVKRRAVPYQCPSEPVNAN